jgi:peptide/nickel transport system substrate-binding protein
MVNTTRRGRLSVLVLLLSGSLLAAACGSSTSGPSRAPGASGPAATPPAATTVERVRAGIVGDESSLNPYTYVTGFPGWNLLMLQYDTLLQIDVEGVPQPWLARSFEVSDDGLTYTVQLEPDVKWSDGEPLTAEDVVFTVEYFGANAQSRFTGNLASVASATATADLEVTFTLKAPNPSFELRALADVPIMPEHVWSTVENPTEATFDSPTNVGTGPYQIVEYTPDQSYRLKANADYFRGAPLASELVIVQYADESGLVAALRSDEVDVSFRSISPEQVAQLSAVDGMKIAEGPEFTTQMLYYDVTKPPFDQVAVRRAMSLAIDRQDLADTVFLGKATLGNLGWTHPSSPAFNDAVKTTTDVAAATALLDGAGITDSDGDGVREFNGQPLRPELLAPSDNPLRLRLAELIKEMLKQIGIDPQVTSIERETLVNRVWPDFDVANGRDYQMSMFGWSAPVQVDPNQITTLVHSDPAIGSINISGFSNPEADRLSDAIRVEPDEARRQQLLDELQQLIADDLPFIMLLYGDGLYPYRSTVYDQWAFIAGQGIVTKLSLLPPDARP